MSRWLVDASSTDVSRVIAGNEWQPCPRRYGPDAVRKTARGENGDPLVEVPDSVSRFRVYAEMPLSKMPPLLQLRKEVITRLRAAEMLLPAGVGFVILDGWRTLAFQAELVSYYAEQTASVVDDMFVSDPTDDAVAPPHTTGGAIDLTLQYAGRPLGLGTDFDAFEARAELDWFERIDDDQLTPRDNLYKQLRRCMSNALSQCGFAHYPWEWWHWSYGDQWWAARYSISQSLYSEIG